MTVRMCGDRWLDDMASISSVDRSGRAYLLEVHYVTLFTAKDGAEIALRSTYLIWYKSTVKWNWSCI